MKISNIYRIKRYNYRIVVGIGKFDGFHIGHQKLVSKIIEISHKLNAVPAVFTFKNYPFDTRLSLWKDKTEAFKKYGIRLCLWANFSEIHQMSAQNFMDMIKTICNLRGIVVGENFRFGFHRKGDISFLKTWTKTNHIKLSIVKTVIINNKIVSSSEIKKLIKNSCFQEAALLLGRYFTIEGRFIKGRGIGKTIEFPTINIDIKNKNTPVQPAVYACFVKHKNRMFKAAVFYGKSPTFNTPLSFEIHILDETNIDIDKNDIFTIIPIKKIRGIKNFSSPQALTNQIKKDIAKTEKILDSIDFSSLFYKV